MAIRFTFICSIIVIFVVCSANAVRIPLPNGRSYDEFRLVLQWGRTLSPGFGVQIFTIHGLWPEDSTPGAPYLLRCQSIRFDRNLVSDLVPQMNYLWANPLGTNIWLWTHEYEEHGTCCELSQHEYFEIAMQLSRNLDVDKCFYLTSLFQGKYNPAAVYVAAINSCYAVFPRIVCAGDLIKEIHFKFTNDPGNYVEQDMPQPYLIGCNNLITYK